jgi:hypothetical protein
MSLDDKIVAQAQDRADVARQAMIEEVKAGMINNPNDPAVQTIMQMQGYRRNTMDGMTSDPTNKRYADRYDQMANANAEGHRGPVEILNQAMADNAGVRYGVIGTAGLGGGALATAGAQKVAALMGLLQESDETEVARDQPLTS